LLEGLVFGARSGQAMIKDFPVSKRHAAGLPGSPAPLPGNGNAARIAKSTGEPACSAALDQIRDVMWQKVGVLRDGKDLISAIKTLEAMDVSKCEKPGRRDYETRNLHTLALLIARSALARVESRGSHYGPGFPDRDSRVFPGISLWQRAKLIGSSNYPPRPGRTPWL